MVALCIFFCFEVSQWKNKPVSDRLGRTWAKVKEYHPIMKVNVVGAVEGFRMREVQEERGGPLGQQPFCTLKTVQVVGAHISKE